MALGVTNIRNCKLMNIDHRPWGFLTVERRYYLEYKGILELKCIFILTSCVLKLINTLNICSVLYVIYISVQGMGFCVTQMWI